MKSEEWKYGYVRHNFVVVFNGPTSSFPVFEGNFLVNVRLEVCENGTLRITGTKLCYNFYIHETSEEDWKDEPEDYEIRVKKVGIFKRKEKRFLIGWVRTKKRIPFDLEFGNGWTLERRGNVNEGLSRNEKS